MYFFALSPHCELAAVLVNLITTPSFVHEAMSSPDPTNMKIDTNITRSTWWCASRLFATQRSGLRLNVKCLHKTFRFDKVVPDQGCSGPEGPAFGYQLVSGEGVR